MDKSIKQWAQTMFDNIKHTDENGNEFWYARELEKTLGYASWQNFSDVVTKAKISLAETGQTVENHFNDVIKMVPIGSGGERATDDVKLTRYACYIVAQNANAKGKPAVAGAQAYFAIQTRNQELENRREFDVERLIARQKYTDSDKSLSEAVMEKGVSGRGLGQIKSSGDKVMFGGKTTNQMKKVYEVPLKKPLANRMPNVVLAAKTLANEMTATNLEQYPIDGFDKIRTENDGNNARVRKALGESNIVPEKLAPAEDTDEVMKRIKNDGKQKAIEGKQRKSQKTD